MIKNQSVPPVHFDVILIDDSYADDVKKELESLDKDLKIYIKRYLKLVLVDGMATQNVYEKLFQAKIDYRSLKEGKTTFQDWRELVRATVPVSLQNKIKKIKLIETHNVEAVMAKI